MARTPARKSEDLLVWQKAHALVLDAYRYSAGFPRSEVYGLSSQLRRAVVSVAANIAEGFKRRAKAEKLRFLNIAQASLEETRYFFILARDLAYGESCPLQTQADEVSRMLQASIAAIERSGAPPP